MARYLTSISLALIVITFINTAGAHSSSPCYFAVNGSKGVIHFSRVLESANCTWLITTPPRSAIKLRFPNFYVSSGWVEVYDGNNTRETLLGKFCGTKPPSIIQSSGHFMTINYVVLSPGVVIVKARYSATTTKDKPRVVTPLAVVRTVPDHYVWCSSEGTPPISMSLMKSSTILAYGKGAVWSKINKNGNYTCMADSEYGVDTVDFTVTMLDPVSLCKATGTQGCEIENTYNCEGTDSATRISEGIPTTTTSLNLGSNKLTELQEQVFSKLISLRHL